ncbi:MAG: hypothetical protein KJ858_03470 [Nanoarchaeota archaeon]|nr:hypothetical protein [Nanoarchaeota archaeon]
MRQMRQYKKEVTLITTSCLARKNGSLNTSGKNFQGFGLEEGQSSIFPNLDWEIQKNKHKWS